MDNEIMQNPISIPSECLKRVKQCGTPWKSAGLFKSFSVGAGAPHEAPHKVDIPRTPLYPKKSTPSVYKKKLSPKKIKDKKLLV